MSSSPLREEAWQAVSFFAAFNAPRKRMKIRSYKHVVAGGDAWQKVARGDIYCSFYPSGTAREQNRYRPPRAAVSPPFRFSRTLAGPARTAATIAHHA